MKKRIKIRYCYECGYYRSGICTNDTLPVGWDIRMFQPPIFYPEPDFFCADAIPVTEETKKRLEEKVGEWIPTGNRIKPHGLKDYLRELKCSKCGYEEHSFSAGGPARCPGCGRAMAVDVTPPNLYECDPEKNTECTKEGCFINGGPCHITVYEEFKKEEQNR